MSINDDIQESLNNPELAPAILRSIFALSTKDDLKTYVQDNIQAILPKRASEEGEVEDAELNGLEFEKIQERVALRLLTYNLNELSLAKLANTLKKLRSLMVAESESLARDVLVQAGGLDKYHDFQAKITWLTSDKINQVIGSLEVPLQDKNKQFAEGLSKNKTLPQQRFYQVYEDSSPLPFEESLGKPDHDTAPAYNQDEMVVRSKSPLEATFRGIDIESKDSVFATAFPGADEPHTPRAKLEKTHDGTVRDLSPKDAKLSKEELELVALKQAQMLIMDINPHDKEQMHITISGGNKAQGDRIYAALLLFKREIPALKNLKITSHVPGRSLPEESLFTRSKTSRNEFISEHLPKNEEVGKTVAQTIGLLISETKTSKQKEFKMWKKRYSGVENSDKKALAQEAKDKFIVDEDGPVTIKPKH